jgi:hypothetical protein
MPGGNDDVWLFGDRLTMSNHLGRSLVRQPADRTEQPGGHLPKQKRQTRLQKIRLAPLPLGREQSDALCKALQGMTTFVMKPDV